MTPEIQTALTVGVPTLAVLIGILVNNSRLNDLNERLGSVNTGFNTRIDDLRSHVDHRMDDLKDTWRSELRRVEEVLDARLSHLEERLR